MTDGRNTDEIRTKNGRNLYVHVRKMVKSDIEFLRLDADWVKKRYEAYLDAENGPAWILEDEKGLLCAFGGAFLWPSVCEVWFNLIRKEKIKAQIRILKQFISEQSVKLNVRRVFATTKCDSKIGNRFLEFFGFKGEQPDGSPVRMKYYFPDGSDAFMFVRII